MEKPNESWDFYVENREQMILRMLCDLLFYLFALYAAFLGSHHMLPSGATISLHIYATNFLGLNTGFSFVINTFHFDRHNSCRVIFKFCFSY